MRPPVAQPLLAVPVNKNYRRPLNANRK